MLWPVQYTRQTNHIDMPSADRPSSFVISMLAVTFGLSLLAPPLQAQDSGDQQAPMHYSLYYENFKNDEFERAKSDLNWLMENAPGFPKGDDRNFRRQYQLYEGLAANAQSDEKRLAYLDTAATLLASAPQRMEEQGIEYEEYSWEIRKGRFLQEHQDALPELTTDELHDYPTHYRRAFELAPQEVDPYYIRQGLRGYLEMNEQEEGLTFLSEVESKRGDDEEVQQILSSVRQQIFSKNPQARITHLEQQLEAHPDSVELMDALFNAYVDQGNVSRASEIAPRLMETNPPAETVREIAELRLDDGRPREALEAYDRAAEQGAELQAQDYFNRGQAYEQLNNFAQARQEYRQAINLQEDFGEAYVAIGDLYTQAVNECSGSQLERDDKAVYWVAVDKYRQAIQVDSSVESVAESKIQSYRKVFPTQEDIFYRESWQEGEPVTIDFGCYSWINESTTVRQAP